MNTITNVLLLFGCGIGFVSCQTYQLSSSCGGVVQTGGSCTLTCQTSESAISWNDRSRNYIQERVTCSSTGPSLPPGYTSACPTSTTYTISFTNARYDRDSRTWKCGSAFGGNGSNELKVTVYSQKYNLSSSCRGTVQTGGSCTMTCQTSQAAISWSDRSRSYIQERLSCSIVSPSLPSGYTSACPTSTTYTISFTNARYDRDSRIWKCQSAFGATDVSSLMQIEVTVPLTSVTLSRTSSSIICTAVSNPPSSITLYRDGSSVFTSPPAVKGSNGWTATLNYQLSGDTRKHMFWCEASNTKTSVNSSYSLPQIAVTSVHMINISNNNQEVGVAEGQSLTLTCVTSATFPPASVTWYKNNSQVSSGVSSSTQITGVATLTTSSVTFNPISKSDQGYQVYCRAANQHTSSPVQSNTARIGVWYAPDVILSDAIIKEGQPLTLICQAEGRPATYTFRNFTQYWGNTEIQTRAGQQTSDSYTLRVDTVSYLDSGVYACSVDNGVMDRGGVLIQKKKVNVSVSAIPKFTLDSASVFAGEFGDTVTLQQSVYSNNNCTASWNFRGKFTDKKTERIFASQVTLDVYRRTVQGNGWTAVMTIYDFQEGDIGEYTLTVCNIEGCNTSSVNLTVAAGSATPPQRNNTGVIVGSILSVLVVSVIVVSVVIMYRNGYRCAIFKKDDKTVNKRNEQPADMDNAAYSSIDQVSGVPTNIYSSLENTEAQQYTQLSLYEYSNVVPERNFKEHPTFRDTHEQQQDTTDLHTHGDPDKSNKDPDYENAPKT